MRREGRRRTDRGCVDAAAVLGCLVLTGVRGQGALVGAAPAGDRGGRHGRQPGPVVAAAVAGRRGGAGAAAFALSGNPGPWLVGVYSGASYGPASGARWSPPSPGGPGSPAGPGSHRPPVRSTTSLWPAVAAALVVAVGLYTATRRRCGVLARPGRAGRGRAPAARRAGPRGRTHPHRAGDARRAGPQGVADRAARRRARADRRRRAGPGPAGAGLIRVTAREALQELRYVLGVLRADAPAEG